jgi:hypothetical protein
MSRDHYHVATHKLLTAEFHLTFVPGRRRRSSDCGGGQFDISVVAAAGTIDIKQWATASSVPDMVGMSHP